MQSQFTSEKEERKYYSSPADSIYKTRQGNQLVRAEALLHEGRLPGDFKHWDIKTSQGLTIAHAAAHHGLLPEGFDQWDLRANKAKWERETVAHVAARNGSLPDSFKGWGLEDELHRTVLERAVDYNHKPKDFDKIFKDLTSENPDFPFRVAGNLPEGFDDWTLKASWSQNGSTIAHSAARLNKLPANFSGWMISDSNGNTVAHELVASAFLERGIPESFDLTYDQWMAQRDDGMTVIGLAREKQAGEVRAQLETSFMAATMRHQDVSAEPFRELPYKEAAQALREGTLPADFNDWGKKNEAGWTLAHAAASIGRLPPDFKDWSMEGAKPGITVAHVAMRQGTLPASFDDWGIKDASGKTLSELAAKHPTMGAEYQARIEASKQAQQPNTEARSPEPQAAKPSPEAQAQGGKNNQAAPIETSSTGRITGGGRFSRPPDSENREPDKVERKVSAFISRGGL